MSNIFEHYAQIINWSDELVKIQIKMENARKQIEKQMLEIEDSINDSDRCLIKYLPGPPRELAIISPLFPPKIQINQASFYGRDKKGPSMYAQVRDLWLTTIGDALLNEQNKMSEPIQNAIVWYLFAYPDKRNHDPDNYAIKFIHDILVKCNILEDDDYKCLKYIAEGFNNDKPGTIIVITENVGQLDLIRPKIFDLIS